jgi:HEPN domain-containing protein
VKGLVTLPPEYQTHDLRALLHATGWEQAMAQDRRAWDAFQTVDKIWSVEMRYTTKPYGRREAENFFEALGRLEEWLEQKMRSFAR